MPEKKSSEIDNLKSTNRTLVIALIIAAFFLGALTNKVSTLGTAPTTQPIAQTQPVQQGAGPAITNDNIKTWAKDLGLNSTDFNTCFDEQKFKTAIEEDNKAGQTAQVSGTPSFIVNGILLVGAQPFDAFKTIIDQELAGTTPTDTPRTTVDNGHLPVNGKTGAKITIVEFADLECPFCRRFFLDTYPQIKKEYIDTGKAVMYFRHFPLSFHPLAIPFANAVECANEQGKFWEMHDKIYAEQGT